jgi:hypothetical protein
MRVGKMEQQKEYTIEEAEANFNNKEFMLKAIEDNSTWVLAYASDDILADRDIILKAVKVDGQIFYYASPELRDDKEVALEAISNKWLIIKYASKRLRGDKDIAIAALNQNIKAEMYLTDEIKKDSEVDLIINPSSDSQ